MATKKRGAISIKIDGVVKALKQLKDMEKAVQKQVRETLQRELSSWIIDAQIITPVDTSALQKSGRLLKPRGKSIVKYELIFGGVSRLGKFVDYALEVHENHATMSKFLQKVVDARAPQLEKLLAKDLDRAAKSAL